MSSLVKKYTEFILESKKSKSESFEEFAQKRYNGAKKIADTARAKGGPATLTYHHFQVKLKHYMKAAAGKFDSTAAKAELEKNIKLLGDRPSEIIDHNPIEFQKIMGIIEVLGELLIEASH